MILAKSPDLLTLCGKIKLSLRLGHIVIPMVIHFVALVHGCLRVSLLASILIS